MKVITIQAALLVALAMTGELMAQAVKPLKIDLPKPMFVGTPKTIKSAKDTCFLSCCRSGAVLNAL